MSECVRRSEGESEAGREWERVQRSGGRRGGAARAPFDRSSVLGPAGARGRPRRARPRKRNCVCDATSCGTGCCSIACLAGTADTACGGSGRACTSCSSTQVCVNQACVACGGAGQPCCHPSNTCNTGNRCDTGTSTCQPCGGLGQACCGAAPLCNTFGACLSSTQCVAKDVWVGAQFPRRSAIPSVQPCIGTGPRGASRTSSI